LLKNKLTHVLITILLTYSPFAISIYSCAKLKMLSEELTTRLSIAESKNYYLQYEMHAKFPTVLHRKTA